MNKKEKEEVETLKTRLALRFFPPVEPDVDIPLSREIINGWAYNEYTMVVSKACTSSVSHGYGKWNKTTSQRPIKLYSTQKLAYAALLNKLSKKFANELRGVEKRMEECDE